MSRVKKRSRVDLDESDIFSHEAFDVPEFVDVMEQKDRRRGRDRASFKLSRQQVESRREMRWLEEQLEDWESWEHEPDSH